MINENFFSLAQGECGVPISFEELFTVAQNVPRVDANNNPVNDPTTGNQVIDLVPAQLELSDNRFVTIEFSVADVYPKNTIIDIVPNAYVIQKPRKILPQTTVLIKSRFDFGAQVLLQLNVKSSSGDILYTDYQIIVVGNAAQRNCQNATQEKDIGGEDVVLDMSNSWKYIHNDHNVAILVLPNNNFDKSLIVGKLTKKSKDILPVRLPSEDTGPGASRQIAAIPAVSIIKRSVADSEQKVGELIYNESIYNNEDVFKFDINNKNLSGLLTENIIKVSGEYYVQHLLSYSNDNTTNSITYTNQDNSDPNYSVPISKEYLIFDGIPHSNNHFLAYSTGVYRWDTSSSDLAIAILNKGYEDKILYSGVAGNSTVIPGTVESSDTDTISGTDSLFVAESAAGTYDFIKGLMEITIKEGLEDNFLSYYVLDYGYMGGSDKLVLSNKYEPTPTPTPTMTVTPSITPTPSVTSSITPTPSITPSITPSLTPTISVTPSITASATPTISITPSITPTISVTPSLTPTLSVTPSVTPTLSVTPTTTLTPTATATPTLTPTLTPTTTATPTPTISITPTISLTPSVSPTLTPTPTVTPSPTQDASIPGAVQGLILDRDELSLTINLSWSAPLFNGASNLTSYVIEYKKTTDSSYVIQNNSIANLGFSIDFSDPDDLSATWMVNIRANNSNGDGIRTFVTT